MGSIVTVEIHHYRRSRGRRKFAEGIDRRSTIGCVAQSKRGV